MYQQASSPVAQAKADRATSHAADHTRAASNTARFHSRMQEDLNASRTLASLSKNVLFYAHKLDAKRGNFARTWRGSFMIVGSHSGKNNYTHQTIIDQKVHRTTFNINDLGPFLDTDDFDKIDTSDVLPFPQLLSPVIQISGGDTTTARKPCGRGSPLVRKTARLRKVQKDFKTSY
jgi:hypothetical protein